MTTPDITVRGAGVFGLSIAWALVKRGAQVRVIDPNGIGAGASGGVVGALAPHVPEQWNTKKAFQLESLWMAQDWWRAVEDYAAIPSGYGRTGRLQPLADEKAVALAQNRAQSAAALWPTGAEWRVIPASGDWHPPSPSGWMVKDTLTARIHPMQAVQCLATAIRAKGGEIATEGENLGQTVWATGFAGLQHLTDSLGQNMGGGEKGQAAVLAFSQPDAPQIFVDGLHIIPHSNGTTAIGSTSEKTWDDPTSTDAQLDTLIARARAVCPALADARVLQRWAGLRPRSKSRAPILGLWPDRPGHYIANGGFKIGFGMAPKIAETMADLILDNVETIPEAFRVPDAI
jgi:glycine/D-amino acid oxidase-like deaminating enzyme